MKNTTSRTLWPLLIGTTLALAGCGGSDDNPPPVAKSDPLFEHQWHLKNTGQTNFSSESGVAGIDLNVAGLFDAGITGSGVKVLVLDDGLDIRHPDLAANVDAARLRNLDPGASNASDPTPTSPDRAHGTAVAGIIASVAHNGLGGRGIAPGASLGGANLLNCGTCDDTSASLDAYGGAAFSQNADVINGSFGVSPAVPVPVDIDTEAEMRALRGLSALRGGKGVVMVKSAGNEFAEFTVTQNDGSEAASGQCGPAQQHGLTCQNAAFDPQNTMPQVVTTAAVNARGVKSSYSNAGASLLVSGLGGEYGNATPDSPAEAGPALLTTDLAGCDRGYARTQLPTPYANDFDNPATGTARQLNPGCDYTSAMNGTSAAAPTVTGVVALMLAANPNLTWRDLRLILAKTSRQIDAGIAPKKLALARGDYIAEPAWTTNAAGLKFHNWYGYGLVNGAAAVAMAKSYTSHLPGNALVDSGWLDASAGAAGLKLAVPLEDPNGASSQITFAAARTIEAVQVRVTLDGSGLLGDLGIELVSPRGTRSVLMNAHNAFQQSGKVEGLLLASNAFNEEKADGVWTLRVVDVNGRQAKDASGQAILAHWSLRVHGR